jgi:hypothetical protein
MSLTVDVPTHVVYVGKVRCSKPHAAPQRRSPPAAAFGGCGAAKYVGSVVSGSLYTATAALAVVHHGPRDGLPSGYKDMQPEPPKTAANQKPRRPPDPPARPARPPPPARTPLVRAAPGPPGKARQCQIEGFLATGLVFLYRAAFYWVRAGRPHVGQVISPRRMPGKALNELALHS